MDLENGRLTAYSGGYTSYRRQKAERVLAATRAFEKQQEFIEKEQEYIRRNIAGVNSRQAKGRRTRLARVERLEKPAGDATSVDFRFDAARIGGRVFLRAKDLDAGYAAGAPDRPPRVLRAAAGRAAGDSRRERHGQDDAAEDARRTARPARRARRRPATTSRSATTTRSCATSTRKSAPSTPSGTSTPTRPRSRSGRTWRASRSGATTCSRRSRVCREERRGG